MEKISGIYKITNTITGDFYIGSSKNVKLRWASHKRPSTWSKCKNNPLYLDMQKYSLDKFSFEILEEVEIDKLKEKEQQFIEKMNPTYNNRNADGLDIERRKEYKKQYQKTDKCKKYNKEYKKSNKYKEYIIEYQKTDKYKETQRKANNKYYNQLCRYNGEVLTLNALRKRFQKTGIAHPTIEARKYLML